jgi:D-alanyl-D-alanine dipeptidase
MAAKRLGEAAALHRRILSDAILPTGITNYPSEYWHWSYGDQGWAYRGGHPHAIYGPVTPTGYVPPEGDDVDEPLVWVD